MYINFIKDGMQVKDQTTDVPDEQETLPPCIYNCQLAYSNSKGAEKQNELFQNRPLGWVKGS